MPNTASREDRSNRQLPGPKETMAYIRNEVIKFTHAEVEALLGLFPENESDLNLYERNAKEKLKAIYARQILSYERTKKIYGENFKDAKADNS